jgi:hypothetical protein
MEFENLEQNEICKKINIPEFQKWNFLESQK